MLGQTIGNYVVKQKLGEGGMGSVYLAEHPAIGKKVALKVLHAEFAANQEVVSRFFNEARAVNDIQHPNIVDIVDYGVLAAGPAGDQMVYFIMEFLPGITLSELIRRESPLAPERSLSICLQVADALAASHIKGIIHRDLKPDNIILLQRGRERDFVKLLDFGIAKLTGDQPGSRRTRTGIVMGTPAYMSPEQCEGRGNIDHRTDIYALGIVLYEMITGRVPFVGEGYGEVLVQHLTQAPAAPSTIRGLIPPHVEQIVLKALEKQPQARYPTMEEMMRAMQDPVGYVEAHGGLAGFKNAVLTPSNAPLQAGGVRLTPTPTPSPLNPLTPLPGSVGAVAAPGTPTTLGASAGQVAPSTGGGKKIGIFVGIGVAVAAIAAAIVLLVGSGGGGGKKADDTKDEDTVANNDDTGDKGTDKGSDTEVKAGQDTGDKGTDKGSDTGSETATDNGGGKGSDTGSDTGTGTGTGTVTDNGGTTGTGTGSDTGTGTGTGTATDNGGTTGTGTGSDTGTGTGTGTGTVAPKAKIKITIDSSPSGAMVFVGTEKEPRGKTPYNFEVDEGPGTLEVKLFVKKYKWEKIKIPTDQGAQTLDVKLEKEKKSGGGGGHKTGGGDSGGDDSGSDDTMNPFKKKKP